MAVTQSFRGVVRTRAEFYGVLQAPARFKASGGGSSLETALYEAAVIAVNNARAQSGSVIFTFDSSTVDADPGAGSIRLNAAVHLATAAYIDNLDVDGTDVSAMLDVLDDSTSGTNKATLFLREGVTGRFAVYRVTGAVVDASGYRAITISHVASSAGGFTSGNRVGLSFNIAGDKASAAGADTQVQFRDGTEFAGSSAMSFNKTTGVLTLAEAPFLSEGATFGPNTRAMFQRSGSDAFAWTLHANAANELVFETGVFGEGTVMATWADTGALALRSGAFVQFLNSYTDASNYERLGMFWSGGSFYIDSQAAGTGSRRDLYIGGQNVGLTTSGTLRWVFDYQGHLYPLANDAYDLGQPGQRVRNIHVTVLNASSNVWVGGFVSATGDVQGKFLASAGLSGVPVETASSGVKFSGSGIAHANIAWMPNEREFRFATGENADSLADNYSTPNIRISGHITIGNSRAYRYMGADGVTKYNFLLADSSDTVGLYGYHGNPVLRAFNGSVVQYSSDGAGAPVGTWTSTGLSLVGRLEVGSGLGQLHTDANGFYVQSFNSKPLFLNSLGNSVVVGSGISWGVSTGPRTVHGDGSGTILQLNGTLPQTYMLHNTFIDGSNYERGGFQWAADTLFVRTMASGTGVSRQLAVGTEGSASLLLRSNATFRWAVDGAGGHLYAYSDNVYDVGASSGNRPRDLHIARVLYAYGAQTPGGGAGVGAPTADTRSQGTRIVLYPNVGPSVVDYAIGIDGGTFWYSVTNETAVFKWYFGTTTKMTLDGNGALTMTGALTVGGQTFLTGGDTFALGLYPANDNLRNLGVPGFQWLGVTAQNHYAYNLYTDGSNYERLEIVAGSTFNIVTRSAGVGEARALAIGTVGAAPLNLITEGVTRWFIASNGHLHASADSTYDVGATATNRPRDVFVGRHLLAFGATVAGGAPGVSPPTVSARAAGTRLVLYASVGPGTSDYAFGIDDSTLWSSVNSTFAFWKWYGGDTLAATLSGSGSLTLVGGLTAAHDLRGRLLHLDGIAATLDPGMISSGIFFGGSGVAHGTVVWMPNERTYILGTGNSPLESTGAYGAANLKVLGNIVSANDNPNNAKGYFVQETAGRTGFQVLGVTGAQLIVDFVGGGSNFYDANTHMIRTATYENRLGISGGEITAYVSVYPSTTGTKFLGAPNVEWASAYARAFVTHNFYTDGSNYERGTLQWQSNTLFLSTEKAGSGLDRGISIGTVGDAVVRMFTSGTNRWEFTGANFQPYTDNVSDLGSPSARVKSVYAQSFTIHNAYTDVSNYERLHAFASIDNFWILAQAAGTGTVRPLHIGASSIYLDAISWHGGNLYFGTPNVFDIGDPLGLATPRHVYVGSTVTIDKGLHGKNYAVTATDVPAGTTIVDTGVFVDTADVGFGDGAMYELFVNGCPNADGSTRYRVIVTGFVSVVTGWNGSELTKYIDFTQTVQVGTAGTFVVEAVFWDGVAESDNCPFNSTDRQIRLKVDGYAPILTAMDLNQQVTRLIKRI